MWHRLVCYLVSNVSEKPANFVLSSTLGIEKAGFSETLVNIYQINYAALLKIVPS
jgi:hypothetical protein